MDSVQAFIVSLVVAGIMVYWIDKKFGDKTESQ
jgi:hypothetical protein